MEKAGVGERRGQLLAHLTGRVLEVDAGNGMNFAHYPREVTAVVAVVAVEPEPHLRAFAETKASDTAISIDVVNGKAETALVIRLITATFGCSLIIVLRTEAAPAS